MGEHRKKPAFAGHSPSFGGRRPVDPLMAAVAAWAIPGAGHLLLDRKAKALLFFVLIVGTFLAGWFITDRQNVYLASGRWHMILQAGAGLVAFAIAFTLRLMQVIAPEPKLTVMHLFEIGTLYTMVAGLLNILVIMDAVVTSLRLRREAS